MALDCEFRLRSSPARRLSSVRIGCGAGFAGDRPAAAVKLLERVPGLHYLVLECLAERTFAECIEAKAAGGKGYDSRISEWMLSLLPSAVAGGTCIITNMGGVDPRGARKEVLDVASQLGLKISVAIASEELTPSTDEAYEGSSTYLGAVSLVHALELGKSTVVITSRLADAALFLAPMVYELGWNWNDFSKLAQGALAGHLLECGCQLSGGYYMHPADPFRSFPAAQLLDTSLPYAEVHCDGTVIVGKAENSGGELSPRTCTQQLLYEIADPSSYITPDVILDLRQVKFEQLTNHKVLVTGAQPHPDRFPEMLLRLVPKPCGWKAWGEISYGGLCCEERAKISDYLVRSWIEEAYPGAAQHILSYCIGKDSLFNSHEAGTQCQEVRLRLDGLFDSEAEAVQLVRDFTALYTNGPAGGGGISCGHKKDMVLSKELVARSQVLWTVSCAGFPESEHRRQGIHDFKVSCENITSLAAARIPPPAPAGCKLPLYKVAHSRTGDKGDTLNFSLIPHCPEDISRLQQVITSDWVEVAVTTALKSSPVHVSIYLVQGVSALNVVVDKVLDKGVTCSRRIDRHGKTLSDMVLSQVVVLP